MTEAKREQAFYVVRKDGRKIVMTLGAIFDEDDDSTQECLDELKQAFADGATFAILDAEEAFKSYGICPRVYHDRLKHDGWQSGKTHPPVKGVYERHFTDGVFEQYWNGKQWLFSVNGDRHWRQVGDYPCWRSKLWAVNIPPEPDSILFYPVPSLQIAKELTERLKKEALARFKINGDVISDSIYFEEWKGTEQEHADFLLKHGEWWIHTTFLDEKTSKDVHDKTNDLIQRAESYLEKFSSSGKIAESLIQELINQLKATNYAFAVMTHCHKEWSEMAIKQKAHIERVDAIAKQQIAYHQSYVDKYINNDVERANRHIERINAWQSITSLQVKDN